MNARTLMISAGAVVALAAPSVANARMLPVKQPSKHVVKKHAAKQHVTKRQGQSRVIYIYYPAPVIQAATSLEQIQQDYNNDLIAHGLDPVDFGNSTQAPASEPAPAPETQSSDASPAPEASLAAAAASSTSETVASTATDDAYLDC